MLNKALGILPNFSEHGPEIDHMLEFCHWFMLILFVGWSLYFLYTIWRFHRSRQPKADYHGVRNHVSTHLEVSVIIIEAVILLGFALPLWGKRVNELPAEDQKDALRVRAMGFQFGWFFHYAGADGKFARQHLRFIDGSNELGIDPNDPDGADDVVVKNDLHLINKKATLVRVSARDVIHGFALHQMRVQQDAMPGTEVPLWFRPIGTGTWQIICAQLCGAGHSTMQSPYSVEEQAAFDDWYKGQKEFTQGYLTKQRENMAAKAAEAPAAGEHGAGHGSGHAEEKKAH